MLFVTKPDGNLTAMNRRRDQVDKPPERTSKMIMKDTNINERCGARCLDEFFMSVTYSALRVKTEEGKQRDLIATEGMT
jgi:hypothetical protein